MQQNKGIIWGTLIITFLASIIAFIVPVPNTWPLSNIEFYLPFVANIVMAGLHIGAAILFAANLDVYKAKLRRAYIALATGTIIVGLGTLQISVIAVLDIWRSPYVLGGGMMFPFLVAGFVLYFAIRYLARLVGATHLFVHAWLVVPAALGMAYASSFLPHVQVTLSEGAFDTGIGIIIWGAALLLFSGCLALFLRQHVGALYVRPMGWLAGAVFVSSATLVIQCIYYLITTDYDHIVTRVNSLIAIGSGLMWLRAGYAFVLTKYYHQDIPLLHLMFSSSDSVAAGAPETPVGLVTYAAGLVSNPDDIDPLLDDVRAITAKLKPGESPSNQETALIVATYLKIETYLTTKEPIRTFSKEELRGQFSPKLLDLIARTAGR